MNAPIEVQQQHPRYAAEDALPRFIVFKGADYGWVLRDREHARDYLFATRAGAYAGAEKRRDNGPDFIGSPSDVHAYGKPLESVEHFA